MQEHGYRVIPVNPTLREHSRERSATSRCATSRNRSTWSTYSARPQDVPPIAEDAIAIGAKVLWQQIGVQQRSSRGQGARGGPGGSSGPVRKDRARAALRRPELGRREYQGHLRKAPPLACLLRYPSRVGRMVRIFEGRFGRLLLSDLDSHDECAPKKIRSSSCGRASPSWCSSIPARATRNAAASARSCSTSRANGCARASRRRSTAWSASPSRNDASRSRRAFASSPRRSRSKC